MQDNKDVHTLFMVLLWWSNFRLFCKYVYPVYRKILNRKKKYLVFFAIKNFSDRKKWLMQKKNQFPHFLNFMTCKKKLDTWQ